MDTETNIATYDDEGRPIVRPMTDEELAELEAARATMTPAKPAE